MVHVEPDSPGPDDAALSPTDGKEFSLRSGSVYGSIDW